MRSFEEYVVFKVRRIEAKHKIFKSYCRSITSRKNLPYTLGIKASLQFANLI